MALRDRFLSLSITCTRFIHIVACVGTSFPLWLDNIPSYGHATLVYPLLWWWVFLQLRVVLLWIGMHKYLNTCFLITLDRHLGVELQGHRVIRCLTLRRTAKVLPSFNQEVESQQGHSSVDWDLKPSRLAPGSLFSTMLSCSWGGSPLVNTF